MGAERKFHLNRSSLVQAPSPLVTELSGYMDLGMHKKAVPLALKILRKPKLLPEEFKEIVDVLVYAHPRLNRCVSAVVGAYQGFNHRSRKRVRPVMLCFYYHLEDYPKALLFVARNPKTPHEFVHSLETYVELELEEDAVRLANQGRKVMKRCKDVLEQGAVLSALASFFTRRGDYDKAITLWKLLPGEIALGFDKFESIIKLHVIKAVQSVQEAYQELQTLESEGDPQFEITYPGLHQKLVKNIKRQLHQFSNILGMIISRREMKKYGMD